MELFTLTSHPPRLRKLTNRIRGVDMAEDGADFLEVFRFFQSQGMTEQDAWTNAARVFRGSTPTAGPFTRHLLQLVRASC